MPERVIVAEEIILDKEGKPVAKLIPYEEPRNHVAGAMERQSHKKVLKFSWAPDGLGFRRAQLVTHGFSHKKISDDFDELPKGIAEVFGMEDKSAIIYLIQ